MQTTTSSHGEALVPRGDVNDQPTRTTPLSRREAEAMAAELREQLEGEVRFDSGSRALYATDSSVYRQVPIGVVLPRSVDDVLKTIALARTYHAPVLPRGCGTSVTGQTTNFAVILDMSKYMDHVLEVDPLRRIARVEPGVVCDVLRDAAERYHLTYGPDPATHSRCTLGGMIGNGSCGAHSVMAGRTEDNIESLDIVTYDGVRMRVGATSDDELARIIAEGGRRGEIYAGLQRIRDRYGDLVRQRFPKIPRRVSGYSLDELLPENGFNVARALVGVEGTCVTVLEATTRLVPSPRHRPLVVLGYPDAYVAADHVPEVMSFGPIALEGFDDILLQDMRTKGLHVENIKLLPPGRGWLLVEFGSDDEREAEAQAQRLMDALKRRPGAPSMKLFTDPQQAQRVWQVREAGVGAASVIPGQALTWPSWEDAAVPPDRVGDYLRELREILNRYDYDCSFFGHFGQGCIHMRINYNLRTTEGIKKFRDYLEEAADLVIGMGGSLSGEHGDGQAHADLLPKMFGSELIQAFREFKALWDPERKMNPGKVIDGYRSDQNLRLGPDYNPPVTQTHFQFPEDDHNFANATLRCFGIGKCRRLDGDVEGDDTMCPSYMVTHEEMHSTRGRARLLFEMLQGDPIAGWRNESVKEALDLCLACKGCKHDCPTRVDMATYKAEFLSHYYQGRLRPPTAYSMGLIMYWARLAARAPQLVNWLTHTPGVSDAFKRLGGVAPQRSIPRFATQTFKDWFRQRAPRNVGQPRVMLWGDTFNNYFLPNTAKAAVEVLEAAGFQVVVPLQALCCGRPLYDYGMLDLAKHLLQQTLDSLRPAIRAGIPLVGLEPSCISVFRDELINLFPQDEDAKRLSAQSYVLSEFLEKRVSDYAPPKLRRKALVHGHCHQKAIMTMSAEEAVLRKMGVDVEMLKSGCCGLAGSFGYERGERYDVSIAAGERVLLPAVRAADEDDLIITDGFSCREQILQNTGRTPLHIAEALHMALHTNGQAATLLPTDTFPRNERDEQHAQSALPTAGAARKALGATGLAVGAALLAVAIARRARRT